MMMAAPARSNGSALSRWWPPANGPGTSSIGTPTALTSLRVLAPARLRIKSAARIRSDSSGLKVNGSYRLRTPSGRPALTPSSIEMSRSPV